MPRGLTLKDDSQPKFLGKFAAFPWGMLAVALSLCAIGITALYSAAGGSFDPWAKAQLLRLGPAVSVMIAVAMFNIRWVYWLAYPFWIFCVILLLIVEAAGVIGMGAQRWLNLGFITLQPSDLTKIAVILALARFYHTTSAEDAKKLKSLIIPACLICIPMGLIILQPDLGTAIMIAMAGAALIWLGGAPWWLFVGGGTLFAAATPIAYHFLHDYQKRRIQIFLDPEKDPLGAGYHITQSKIAIGSGGFDGKGFLQGSQAHLDFLPEKHTDFIFTLISEEWGMLGDLVILGLYGALIWFGYHIALGCRHGFGRLLALGLTTNLAVYVVINTGMVMGLMPVVGEPLPLISYGGTVMISTFFALGLVASCAVHKNQMMPS